MKRNSGVYEIVNLINGKRYIGSSVNLHSRFQQHRAKLRSGKHHNRHLQNAWDKYGEGNFTFEVLFYCEKSQTLIYEQQFLDNLQPEYNIAISVSAPMLGLSVSNEVRAKISAATKGNTNCLGNKHTAEHIAKFSAAMKGHEVSAETRAKIGAANKGKSTRGGYKMSEDTKAKIGAANRGSRGYHPTDEARNNMSLSAKAAWQRRKLQGQDD